MCSQLWLLLDKADSPTERHHELKDLPSDRFTVDFQESTRPQIRNETTPLACLDPPDGTHASDGQMRLSVDLDDLHIALRPSVLRGTIDLADLRDDVFFRFPTPEPVREVLYLDLAE